jgi:hypothetical protein
MIFYTVPWAPEVALGMLEAECEGLAEEFGA